jgi:transcriptional regulator with XRE-family HTH domain
VNLLLVENRIRAFLEHSTRYAFRGPARLARECGVSEATICRLLTGYGSPSYAVLVKITRVFEKEFKRSIDPREIASLDGRYPTPTVCELVGCKGCTPQDAWYPDDTLKPGYCSDKGEPGKEAR